MNLMRKKSAKNLNQTRIISRGHTHSLIHTPGRRPIQVRPQINPQTLVLTHIPSRNILPLNPLRAPSKRIALISKRPERILGRRERNRQVSRGRTWRLANISIQLRSLRINKFDQLPIGGDLVLAGGCGGGEDCPAGGGVEGGGLQVFVEVWGGDGADPGVACLEGGACAGARGGSGAGAGCFGGRRCARRGRGGFGGSAGCDCNCCGALGCR